MAETRVYLILGILLVALLLRIMERKEAAR